MSDGNLSYQVSVDVAAAISALNSFSNSVSSVASNVRSKVADINAAFASIKAPNLDFGGGAGGGLGTMAQEANQAAGAATALGAAAGGAGGGITNLGNAAGRAAPAVNNLHGQFSTFKALLETTAILEFGHALIEMSDEATQAFNRVKAATRTGAEAEGVFQALVLSAQATRQPLEQTAEQFQQVTIATNALQLSYRGQIALNQELNQLLVVSGASGQKAKAGIGDLLRGLAAGKITTQELKGMVHDVPQLGQAIADGMGVGIGSLRELNKEGKLTATAVVAALQKVAPSISADFDKMTPTIAGAFDTIKTGILGVIHDFNDFANGGGIVATILQAIGQHADVLVAGLAGIAAVVLTAVIPATIALGTALLGTGIGELAISVGIITAALGYMGEKSYSVAGETVTGWQVVKAVFASIGDVFRELTSMFSVFSQTTEEKSSETSQNMAREWSALGQKLAAIANALIGAFVAAYDIIKDAYGNLPAFMNIVWTNIQNMAIGAAEAVLNSWQKLFRDIASAASTLFPAVGAAMNGALNKLTIKLPRAQASAEGKAMGTLIGGEVRSAFNTDYVAKFGQSVTGHLHKMVKDAKDAKAAVDDIHGGTSPEAGDEDGKKKKGKKAGGNQISDYAKEVDKLNKALYDESLTKDQLQLADALDEAGLKRNILLTGQQADAIRKLVGELQAATAARKVTDELKKLQAANYELGLTEEQRAVSEARIAAGLPADIKIINDQTKAIDAQALANFRLKASQDAKKENANKITRLHEDLDKANVTDKQKRETLLDGGDSTLKKQLASIQKQRIEWEAIIARMKDLDPAQKAALQDEINVTTEKEKQTAILEDQQTKTEKMKDFLVSLWKDPMAAMKEFFTQFLEQLLMSIAKATILKALLPGGGGGGSFGSMVTSALSSAFGGGKAVGGSVSSSKYYMVGENGPELFAPGRSGTIIPNQNIGGGSSPSFSIGGTSITINGNANDNDRQQLAAQQAAWQRNTITMVRKEMERHKK